MRRSILAPFLVCITITLLGQTTYQLKPKQGQVFAQWGWNRAWYTKSDLHLEGDQYNFTLKDVKAHDRQSEFAFKKYFNPAKITIPQTNFRIGYYLNEKWAVSFSFDHMKYVMDQDQEVQITGQITKGNDTYDGEYGNDDISLARNFLRFEHTDGLNYIHLEGIRFLPLWQSSKFKTSIDLTLAGGAGLLRPRTDVYFLGVKGPNEFHIAGYGANLKTGVSARFFNYFYITADLKGGYINMPRIKATKNPGDLASHHFSFLQTNFLIGATFPIISK